MLRDEEADCHRREQSGRAQSVPNQRSRKGIDGYSQAVRMNTSRVSRLASQAEHVSSILVARSNTKASSRSTGLTNQGARNLIRKAEERKWVRSTGTHGRGGREYWLADDVYSVIEAPMSYEDS